MAPQPVVLITGVNGNLGSRLVPALSGCKIIGLDVTAPPDASLFAEFAELDLAKESSCPALAEVIARQQVECVIHLAFIVDPMRSGVLDTKRMWQINVAGTARVVEAVAAVNRQRQTVRRFIHLSSVSVYGPDLKMPVTEEHPMNAHTLNYAVQKKEADQVVQRRAATLGDCESFILRPHIFVGPTVENYLVGILRGVAGGKGKLAQRMRARNKRMPMMLPSGEKYRKNPFQFVHVDDVVRLITHLIGRKPQPAQLNILNVAASGEMLTIDQCAQISGTKVVQVPTIAALRFALKFAWRLGISSVPVDALPYLIGSYTMDTSRLKAFLGHEYGNVIRHSNRSALEDTFPAKNDAAAIG